MVIKRTYLIRLREAQSATKLESSDFFSETDFAQGEEL